VTRTTTHAVRLTTRAERAALRSVRRACYAGLDSLTLRQELGYRVAPVVRFEACAFMSTDPDTGLFTHGWGERLPESLVESYMTGVYPQEVVHFVDLARSGETVSTRRSEALLEVLRAVGLELVMHAVFAVDDRMYGSWCQFRESRSGGFAEPDARFMKAIAPHVARGLQLAATVEEALRPDAAADADAPGVLVLDARRRITLRSGAATAQLADLSDSGMARAGGARGGALPSAVVSVLTRLAAAHVRATGPLSAELRAQGRSRRWYTLKATLAEPDAAGSCATVVVIEPRARREVAPLLSRMYSLTPREREVLVHALRGDTTKRIAARLELSAHTVRDHLDSACGKLGVRGRRELLAKLVTDGYAAVLTGQASARPA
jgi:DNA-binding CsgD family transcriptional regulator